MHKIATALYLATFSLAHAQQATVTRPLAEPVSTEASSSLDATQAKFYADMLAAGYSVAKLQMQQNQYYLDATLNGKQGTFLVDTGAMVSILQESVIDKYKLKLKAPETLVAVGVGGSVDIKGTTTIDTLQCQAAGQNMTQTFHVMPMPAWSPEMAARVDGILGTDFLKNQNAVMDYANAQLWFKTASTTTTDHPTPLQPPAEYSSVVFVEEHNHLFVDAAISSKKVRFILDSGSAVNVFKKSALPNYDFKVIKGRGEMKGLGGTVVIEALAKTQQLTLGDQANIAEQFYVMDMSNWPENYADRFDAILGSKFLSDKKAMINYADNKLWLSR